MNIAESHPTADRASVGEVLRNHRQQKQLSVADAAGMMHLDPKVIEALEADDFDKLPAALYVRGYLRGYGKILGLDPARLIALYDDASPSEPPEIIPEVKHPTQPSSRDKPVVAFTYLVTLTLVLLLVAWWQSNFVIDTEPEPAAAEPEPALPPQLSYPINVVQHPDSPFYRAPDEEAPAEAEAAAAVGAAPGAAPAEVEIHGPPEGPDRLEMRLAADSWIEVFDAEGRKVYVNLAREGETVHMRGTAPFEVLLGFSQGVTITLNGEPFDAAPYSRSGLARFTLGAE